MIAETAGLLSSLKALTDIGGAMLGIRDAVQMNTKLLELQGAIINAQQQAMAMNQIYLVMEAKARDLEAECIRLKDWSAEKEKYTCREIANGVFAYVQNETGSNFQHSHKYCCNCFEQGQKSLLQQSDEAHYQKGLACARCKSEKLVFPRYLDEPRMHIPVPT